MPLSRREIRTRATRFVKQWADAHNEDADAKLFWYEFFAVFGIRARTVGSYEVHVKKLSKADGYIDYFWPGTLLVEHKSRGKNLKKAAIQAVDYLHGVKEHEKPRFILVSDFARFVLYSLEAGTEVEIMLEDLPKRLEIFDFIAGYEARPVRAQDKVNVHAAELMGRLHDALKATGYDGIPGSPERHALEMYLVRLLFILFADDTGIFERDAFYNFIVDQTREDGTDLGAQLARLFQLLNTPEDRRPKNLDDRLTDFKYINGKLFEEQLPLAEWDGAMRVTLLECAGLDWATISPAIFGALFQSAMDAKLRRNLGAHYTSEQNILKLIRPLFLDELWDEFERAKGDRNKLNKFHKKLADLRFLDPACGCGNFLVITYRELRLLEMRVIEVLMKGQQVVDVDQLVLLNVDRFYGIEIEEFPAQIAQVALWLVDHQMNMQVSQRFGEYMVRIPLRKSATIACTNALRVDWQGLLADDARYDYILGNPPFIGSKLMSEDMRRDILSVFPAVKGSGTLDFVSGWYGLAQGYMAKYGKKTTRCAFVSTNSIVQGEQVGFLWGHLLKHGVKIHFAHQTFRWNNEARGVAAVHCVIVGFADFDVQKKRLFEYARSGNEPIEVSASNISPYLVDYKDFVLLSRSKPLCQVPSIGIGNKPIDGGYLLFTQEERDAFVSAEPGSRRYFKRWLGSDEFINGWERWCLWLGDAAPGELRGLPYVLAQLEKVRRYRLGEIKAKSGRDAKAGTSSRQLAATPARFHVENIPKETYLIIPEVSSERRLFIPIGFEEPTTLASNLVKVVPKASVYHFGILTSTMHNAWVRFTCGRLESRYRYSKDIVYNNFPWPRSISATHRKGVEEAAQGILDARAEHKGASLADLYDPLTMPADLLRAHQVLDRAVDRCYRPQPFLNDTKRVEYLFDLYEKYATSLPEKSMSRRKGK